MIVAVKYCGGCNPRYERSEIVKRLKADFPGVCIVSSQASADVAAVICGCSAACASRAGLCARLGVVILTSLEDYEKRLYPLLMADESL